MPTRLYIKRCHGVLYFGKTTQDPYDYTGSGVHWSAIVAKYGKASVETLWVSDAYSDPDTLQDIALGFSRENLIVESAQWANLIPENGLNGGYNTDALMTDEAKAEAVRVRRDLYGNGWGQAHNDASQEKREATMTERYGSVMGACHTVDASESRTATLVERYGSVWGAALTDDAQEKAKKTRNERYENGWYSMTEEQTLKKKASLSAAHTTLSAKTLARPEVAQLDALAKSLGVKLGKGWRSRKTEWLTARIAELSPASQHTQPHS